VEANRVAEVVEREGAIPFDVPDAEFGHHGGHCSFDAIVGGYSIKDRAVLKMANIVRAADTDAALAPEGAGLAAVMIGISMVAKDDHDSLKLAGPVYDALFAYCKAEIIMEDHASELETMNKEERRTFLRRKVDEWVA
jgi:hypothetical protein